MKPSDVPGHMSEEAGEALADLAAKVPPVLAIVELGSYMGRSTCYLASRAEARVWAVDAWDLPGKRGDGTHPYTDPTVRERFAAHLEACGVAERVTAVRGMATDVGKAWAGPPVGLLHIDAGHTRREVLADWRAWKRHLAPGAVVVFDDFDPRHPGVVKAVSQIRFTEVCKVAGRLAVCKR